MSYTWNVCRNRWLEIDDRAQGRYVAMHQQQILFLYAYEVQEQIVSYNKEEKWQDDKMDRETHDRNVWHRLERRTRLWIQ